MTEITHLPTRPAAGSARRPRNRRRGRRNAAWALFFLLPSAVPLVLFTLIPMVASLWVSLHRWNLMMRPPFFDHGDDPAIWAHPQQWLLGDDLLVNPVTAPGATTWDTYLPAGNWVDVWTSQPEQGGRVVTRDVPIDVVPVYCRAAAWDQRRALFN